MTFLTGFFLKSFNPQMTVLGVQVHGLFLLLHSCRLKCKVRGICSGELWGTWGFQGHVYLSSFLGQDTLGVRTWALGSVHSSFSSTRSKPAGLTCVTISFPTSKTDTVTLTNYLPGLS